MKQWNEIELEKYPKWFLIQARKRPSGEGLTINRYETFYGTFDEAKQYSELYSRSHSTKILAIVKNLEQLDILKKIRYYQREHSRILGDLKKELKKTRGEQWRKDILVEKKAFYEKRAKELNKELESGKAFFLFKKYLSKTSFRKIKLKKREDN